MDKVAASTAFDTRAQQREARKHDYARRMSDHVAYALLVYTGLHIFVTMSAIKGLGGSILPFLSLIVLVGGIIPALRTFEKRWAAIGTEQADDPRLGSRFRRDLTGLWLMAIGLPFLLTAIFSGLASFG
ncbi:hypothetical protein ACXYN8_00435 [Altererythrobacter sp. CAU 1778]